MLGAPMLPGTLALTLVLGLTGAATTASIASAPSSASISATTSTASTTALCRGYFRNRVLDGWLRLVQIGGGYGRYRRRWSIGGVDSISKLDN